MYCKGIPLEEISGLHFLLERSFLYLIITISAVFVALLGDTSTSIPVYVFFAYSVASVVPILSIQVRRLRDAGRSP